MQLEGKRRIVDDYLVIDQLRAWAVVSRDDAGDARIGLDRRRRTHANRIADTEAALDELQSAADPPTLATTIDPCVTATARTPSTML
jgi:hypothetical protein